MREHAIAADVEAKPCPECVGGKHLNCTGVVPAGDDYDHLTDCACAVAGHQETP
ncbi:hypothetical protein [Nocardioides marmoriginsengisoli]|uniref:hypothetical protein n=1 Tax=Nocardioides marmoriginsengisoli TaxID=661483 RepID=UPI00161ECA84|nr:hypothetical protein [Nocardioides marmoriginsengisoli]